MKYFVNADVGSYDFNEHEAFLIECESKKEILDWLQQNTYSDQGDADEFTKTIIKGEKSSYNERQFVVKECTNEQFEILKLFVEIVK